MDTSGNNPEGRSWTQWFEIPVTDLDRAKTFYEKIFEVNIEITDFGNFKMGILPHNSVGGALVQGEAYKPSREGTLIYLDANPDLTVTQNRVAEAGGEVLIEKRLISPEYGYMALLLDSEGNRIALHSSS